MDSWGQPNRPGSLLLGQHCTDRKESDRQDQGNQYPGRGDQDVRSHPAGGEQAEDRCPEQWVLDEEGTQSLAEAHAGLGPERGSDSKGEQHQSCSTDNYVVDDRLAEVVATHQGQDHRIAQVAGIRRDRAANDRPRNRPGQLQQRDRDQPGNQADDRDGDQAEHQAYPRPDREVSPCEVDEDDRRDHEVEQDDERAPRAGAGPVRPPPLRPYPDQRRHKDGEQDPDHDGEPTGSDLFGEHLNRA